MRRSSATLAAIAACLALPASPADADEWENINLTIAHQTAYPGTGGINNALISGDRIYYEAWDDDWMFSNDIYAYHDGSITRLSNSASQKYLVAAVGRRALWTDSGNAMLFDGTTAAAVPDLDSTSTYAKALSNTHVALLGRINSKYALLLYDGTQTSIIESDVGSANRGVALSGSQLAYSRAVPSASLEMFRYDDPATHIRLTDDTKEDLSYSIRRDGPYIAWVAVTGAAGDFTSAEVMFSEGGNSVTQLTTDSLSDSEPAVEGDRVSWYQVGGDMMLYDHSEGSIIDISGSHGHQSDGPVMDGAYVAWTAARRQIGGIWRDLVAIYDGTTTTTIQDNTTSPIYGTLEDMSQRNVIFRSGISPVYFARYLGDSAQLDPGVNLAVDLMGGAGPNVGGLSALFGAVTTGGSLEAVYDAMGRDEFLTTIGDDPDALPFIPPAQTDIQCWQISFDGASFSDGQMTLSYNESLLDGASEAALGIWRRNSANDWTMLDVLGRDPTNNTITVRVDAFSAFVLGVEEASLEDPPVTISIADFENRVTLGFPSQLGRSYQPYYSPTLGSWQEMGTKVPGTGGWIEVHDDGTSTPTLPSSVPSRFYWVEEQSP